MLGVSSRGLTIHPLTRAILLTCSVRCFHTALTPRHPLARLQPPAVVSLEKHPHVTVLTHDVALATGTTTKEEDTVEGLQGIYSNGLGRFHRRPIKPINTFAVAKGKLGEVLHIIGTTQSAEDAWEAYRVASSLPNDPITGRKAVVPYACSHRLARLLASTKPRTRTLFLRLLTVLADIKKGGGTIHRWEWNALIDCAGRGWRKTRPEDYKAALDVYEDMVSQANPKETGGQEQDSSSQTAIATPDIVTYTTLLYIAARTLMPDPLRHASNLLRASGLPPNRVSHLAMLRFFTRTNRLSGVRSTIMRIREQGLGMGIDGMNACISAFARNTRVDIASTIYRVLRHNVVPELGIGEHDIDAAIRYLDAMEGILIPKDMIPDRVTYTVMIQGFAYHGDLIQALHVFTHMLSSPDLEPFAPRIPGESDELSTANYPTTLPVFRALFLGFARHAQAPIPDSWKGGLVTRLQNLATPSLPESPWTLANLNALFNSFLELPVSTRPSDRTVYWILVAFAKTSGDDNVKLRSVWAQLERSYGGRWGGRIQMFKKKIYGEIPSDNEQWEV